MPGRLIQLLLALFLIGIAIVIVGPVAATMVTPGWMETADVRDWAGMAFFLAIAAILLVVGFRLAFRRAQSVIHVLRSRDWWLITALSVIAMVCVAIASHWTIALPGLLPIGVTAVMARRRARDERLGLLDAEGADLPPRATFTSDQPSGRRPVYPPRSGKS